MKSQSSEVEMQKDDRGRSEITRHDTPVYTPGLLLAWLNPHGYRNVGRSTIYEALRMGELRSIRRGRKILIPASAVEDWLAGQQGER